MPLGKMQKRYRLELRLIEVLDPPYTGALDVHMGVAASLTEFRLDRLGQAQAREHNTDRAQQILHQAVGMLEHHITKNFQESIKDFK